MTWAAVAIGGASLVGGIASSAMSKPGGGGIATVTNELFPETKGRLKAISDYTVTGLEGIGRGQEPPWMRRYLPTIEEGMRRQNKETYFGRTGMRGEGVMSQASQFGAMTGVGPKATMAYGRKFLSDYASKEQAIDEMLARLRLQMMSEAENRYMSVGAQLPLGPGQQNFQFQEPASPDYFGDIIGAVGAGLGSYLGAGGTFGGGTKPTPVAGKSPGLQLDKVMF